MEHDSILGGLNLFKRHNNKGVSHMGDRPPYPPINESPSFPEVISNTNKADFGLVGLMFLLSIPISSWVSRRMVGTYAHRIIGFNATNTFFIFSGLNLGLINSVQRLNGNTDNGLKWKHGVQNLRKYDLTSEYEDNTIWKYFRHR